MKRFFYLIPFLLFVACSQPPKDAEVIVTGADLSQIEIRHSLEDVYIWDMKLDTLYPNEKNQFIFKKAITKPEFLTVKIGSKRWKSILVPGGKIEISYDKPAVRFQGQDSAAMIALNEFPRPSWSFSETQSYQATTTAAQLIKRINTEKEKELQTIQQMKIDRLIDEVMEKVLLDEVHYFYALRTHQVILSKQNSQKPINDDLLQLYEETLLQNPIENDYKPSSWIEYAETNIVQKAKYDLLASGALTMDSVQAMYGKDELIPFDYGLIQQYPHEATAEKMAARLIMDATKQNRFEKSLPVTFGKFQERYPESPYTPFLQPQIDVIVNYHEVISGAMPDDIQFMDGQNIATLEQLLSQLKGEKYFIDMWATWCGPCKREFAHNEALNQLLASKNYKKLYISIDKKNKEEKWQQDIKYYNLEGLHMLASEDFFVHFADTHTKSKGYLTIPQYLIVDEGGNIVTKHAPKPSEMEELAKVLN